MCIGGGTKFAYGGIAVVIHARAVIGKNCVIGQCVTIGGRSKHYAVPIIGDNRTEEVWVIFLSQSNKIIRKMRVAFGGYTSCLIDVRVILKEALACEAVSLILCHNHPSGNRLPSTDDDRMTQRINEASKIIGLRLIDHVIICRDSYYSYIEEGRI